MLFDIQLATTVRTFQLFFRFKYLIQNSRDVVDKLYKLFLKAWRLGCQEVRMLVSSKNRAQGE